MCKDVQYPVVGDVIRIDDFRIVDISRPVRRNRHRQVVAFHRLHLHAIRHVRGKVYMAFHEMIFLEIEKHIRRKCFQVDNGSIGYEARESVSVSFQVSRFVAGLDNRLDLLAMISLTMTSLVKYQGPQLFPD